MALQTVHACCVIAAVICLIVAFRAGRGYSIMYVNFIYCIIMTTGAVHTSERTQRAIVGGVIFSNLMAVKAGKYTGLTIEVVEGIVAEGAVYYSIVRIRVNCNIPWSSGRGIEPLGHHTYTQIL